MMIFLSSIHFLRVTFLLVHIFSAAAELPGVSCDRTIYGQPNYSKCVTLLYGNPTRRGVGIFNIDSDEHGFLLPYFGASAQFTIDQWRHRVDLPKVWHNDACKIALLVKTSPMGGFTTDSGSWAEIANRGKALIDYCLLARRTTGQYTWGGGVGHAGTHGRLNIVIYAWRSAFDLAISSSIGPDGLVGVAWNKTMANSSASGRIGTLTTHKAVSNMTNGQVQQIFKDFNSDSMSKGTLES